MTLVINPKYEHIRSQLENIDRLFASAKGDLCEGKHTIRIITIDGVDYCVKHYAKDSLPTRIAVTLFKSSNGKRAYMNAALLRERGFIAQEPVAYVSYKNGLINPSTYFVCRHSNFPHTLLEYSHLSADDQDLLIKEFAHYAALLHHQGFSHHAFHSENILFEKNEGHYNFSILDTNGLHLGKPLSVEKGCKNLALLKGDEAFFKALSHAYAEERQADAKMCEDLILKTHHKMYA